MRVKLILHEGGYWLDAEAVNEMVTGLKKSDRRFFRIMAIIPLIHKDEKFYRAFAIDTLDGNVYDTVNGWRKIPK